MDIQQLLLQTRHSGDTDPPVEFYQKFQQFQAFTSRYVKRGFREQYRSNKEFKLHQLKQKNRVQVASSRVSFNF